MITISDTILNRSDVYATGKMILAVLAEYPQTTSGAVARRLRINIKTVHSAMKQMRERGVIVTTRKGNRWHHQIL